jgi:GT2 family glycosyltransferase
VGTGEYRVDRFQSNLDVQEANPVINIVMIVRDRPQHTKQCLESLYCSNVGTQFTFTLVDDGSKKETREVIKKFAIPSRCIQVVRNEDPLGPGGSRNIGVREMEFVRHRYLYFTDNDAFFQPGSLEQLIQALEVGESFQFKVVSGYTHPYSQTLRPVYIGHGMFLDEKNSIGGLSRMMQWDTWEKYGPFLDNAKGVRMSEDWEWDQRVIKDGCLVGTLSPSVIVDTGRTDTFGVTVPGAELIPDVEGVWVQ